MQEKKLYEILLEARNNGSLLWLIAAGVIPPCYQQWLDWFLYKQSTTKQLGLRNSQDRTITYFADLYAVTGGAD